MPLRKEWDTMGSTELKSAGVMLAYRFEYIANIPILFLLCRAGLFCSWRTLFCFCRVCIRCVVTCLLDVTMSQLHGPGLIFVFSRKVSYMYLLFDGSWIFLIIYCSDEHGDRPRPLPDVPELENATDLFVRKESPSWGFDVSKVSLLYDQSRYRIFFGWFIIL